MSKPKAGFSRNLPEQKNVYGHGNATTRNEPVKSKTNNRRFIKGAPETFLLWQKELPQSRNFPYVRATANEQQNQHQ